MIWIIGSGTIACEYAKILKSLNQKFVVVARSGKNSEKLLELGADEVIKGGIDKYLLSHPKAPNYAIVAVNVVELAKVTCSLVEYGLKNVLVEKPACLYPDEINAVADSAERNAANVYVAYNRRYFSSTLEAKKIITEDGGVLSFNFEFTEWGHVIEKLNNPNALFENWMYANSTHVIDLAFFLGGEPREMKTFTADELSWHKPAIFAGAGVSEKKALFSYQANWKAPGRWGVEILTSKHRLYLRPMEKLQIQNIGSVVISECDLNDRLDKDFKPGFYLQTKAFLNGDLENLCTIQEQQKHMENIYKVIKGI